MQAKDIKPRTWYATKEKYGYPDPVLLAGTDRYTIDGRTVFHGDEDKRVIFANPDASLSSGNRYWDSSKTAYLAVKLTNDAKASLQSWVTKGESEEAAHAIMAEAATLLTKVVNAIAERGRVPMAEINQDENRARGIHVTLIEGREIVGDYAELIKLKYDTEQKNKRARQAAEVETERRRQRMVDILTKARALGLNTDPSKGGAKDSYSTYSKYTQVEMSVDTYVAMVAEIERLRSVLAASLRADETGEGGTSARP